MAGKVGKKKRFRLRHQFCKHGSIVIAPCPELRSQREMGNPGRKGGGIGGGGSKGYLVGPVCWVFGEIKSSQTRGGTSTRDLCAGGMVDE